MLKKEEELDRDQYIDCHTCGTLKLQAAYTVVVLVNKNYQSLPKLNNVSMNCYMTARYFSAIALTGTLDYSTDIHNN